MNLALPAWLLIAYCALQLLVHFAAFALWFRRGRAAADERAIFLFHLVSACALTAVAAVFVLLQPGRSSIAAAVAAIFAHGVYSLTFLELWTLAQISYSRDVLLRAREGRLDERAIAELAGVGEAKRALRLQGLADKGLVRRQDGVWSLTVRGRIAGRLLSVLLWLPAVQSPG